MINVLHIFPVEEIPEIEKHQKELEKVRKKLKELSEREKKLVEEIERRRSELRKKIKEGLVGRSES